MAQVQQLALVVAIDGPSGSGKSSVSRGVAERFGYEYLDTGAMYRAATWWVMDCGIDLHDGEAAAAAVQGIHLRSGTDPFRPTIHVGSVDVAEPIRGDAVTSGVSLVAAVPEVRHRMLELQRDAVRRSTANGRGIVVEGRDIGTTVLPDADAKIFLTADAAVRAARRAKQDIEADRDSQGVEATEDAIRRRDELDATRAASPFRMADDAVVVDATDLDLAQTIDAVCDVVRSVAATEVSSE